MEFLTFFHYFTPFCNSFSFSVHFFLHTGKQSSSYKLLFFSFIIFVVVVVGRVLTANDLGLGEYLDVSLASSHRRCILSDNETRWDNERENPLKIRMEKKHAVSLWLSVLEGEDLRRGKGISEEGMKPEKYEKR